MTQIENAKSQIIIITIVLVHVNTLFGLLKKFLLAIHLRIMHGILYQCLQLQNRCFENLKFRTSKVSHVILRQKLQRISRLLHKPLLRKTIILLKSIFLLRHLQINSAQLIALPHLLVIEFFEVLLQIPRQTYLQNARLHRLQPLYTRNHFVARNSLTFVCVLGNAPLQGVIELQFEAEVVEEFLKLRRVPLHPYELLFHLSEPLHSTSCSLGPAPPLLDRHHLRLPNSLKLAPQRITLDIHIEVVRIQIDAAFGQHWQYGWFERGERHR